MDIAQLTHARQVLLEQHAQLTLDLRNLDTQREKMQSRADNLLDDIVGVTQQLQQATEQAKAEEAKPEEKPPEAKKAGKT